MAGSLGEVVAARLGKIGHTDRRQAARRRARESSDVEGQVRLIEVSVVSGKDRGRGARNVLHAVERRLKSDDVCVGLRAVAHPRAHQTMQVTRADAASRGHIRCTDAPVRVLDFVKGVGHDAVEARIGEPLYEKPLQDLDASFGRQWARAR